MFLKSDIIQSVSCSVTCIPSYALSLYMYDPQNTHFKDSMVKGATTEIMGCSLFNERNQVMELSTIRSSCSTSTRSLVLLIIIKIEASDRN